MVEGKTVINTGRIFIVAGLVCVLAGLWMIYGAKFIPFGKLPGDIYVKKEGFTFYFPLTSSILISAVISVILWLISKK